WRAGARCWTENGPRRETAEIGITMSRWAAASLSRAGMLKSSAQSAVVLVCLAAAPLSFAQAPPPPGASQDAPIVANAEEVTLDLIVRDKHGKAVRDLTPADLLVTDDG